MFDKKVKLNNNYEMPMVGLGTWKITDETKIEESIRNAIKYGYRHIDTAYSYGNEKYIGKTLKKIFSECLVKREDLFITSKLWNTYHDDPEKGIRTTLDDLRLDYLDLYLVHWPVKFKSDNNYQSIKNERGEDVLDTFECLKVWKKMEELVEKGLTKSIGVANFGLKNLQLVLDNHKIKPVINQIEIHPYLTQEELVHFCHQHDLHVVSYSSLGGSESLSENIRTDKEILKISEKYNKSVPQVILSWLVMRNILIIPKSSSEKHVKENIDLFELSQEDLKKISSLNKNYRTNDSKPFGPERFK